MKSFAISFSMHAAMIIVLLISMLLNSQELTYQINAVKTVWVELQKQSPTKKLPKNKDALQVQKKQKKAVHKPVKKIKSVIGHQAVKGKALDHLIAQLYQQINAHYQAPDSAAEMQEYGKTIVIFTIKPSGLANQITVKKSSGFPLLDQAATNAVKKASPFKLSPGQLKLSQSFTIPVVFSNNI